MGEDIRINRIVDAEGNEAVYLPAREENQVWKINNAYASSTTYAATPISGLPEPSDPDFEKLLREVAAPPLYEAAKILNKAGFPTCDSYPFEDRGEKGVWAYIAIYWDVLNEDQQKNVQIIANRYPSKAEKKVEIKDFDTFGTDAIQGVFIEVKILPGMNQDDVNNALVKLAESFTKEQLSIT